jgi:hypothetical protein
MRSWRRVRLSTICLWLLTAAMVAVAAMNWHDRAHRKYDVADDLPQLLRSTMFVDTSGVFYCGIKPVPKGMAFGFAGMYAPDAWLRSRPCEVTTVCIRPAVWNTPRGLDQRAENLTWLAEIKTLSKVRISYFDVAADDLTLIGSLPALTTLELDQVPQSSEVWSELGRLEQLKELSLGLPTYRQQKRESVQREWADEDPAEDRQMRYEIDDAVRRAPPSTAAVGPVSRPARIGQRQLKLMRGLPNVHRLTLALLIVDDDVLSQIPSLETLKLSHCVGQREAYLSLADCRRLKELEIERMHPGKFGAAGIAAIPGLRTLRFDGPVSDDEFQAICENRTLTDLELTNLSRLSPQCLGRLAAVPVERLRIGLRGTNSAEELLAALKRVSTLRALTVEIRDMDESHLRGLSHLEYLRQLSIEGPRFTPRQIRLLGVAVPRATLRVHTTESDDALEFPPAHDSSQPDLAADAADEPPD